MRPDRIFFSLAVCALFLIAGAWLDRNVFMKRVTRIEKEIVAVPFPVEKKVERKVGIPIPGPRDTVWATLPCDSLRQIMADNMRPDSVAFVDTLSYADSLASFTAVELTSIVHDPFERVFTRTREVQDAVLKYTKVTTHDVELVADPVWAAVAFAVGLLLALLIS